MYYVNVYIFTGSNPIDLTIIDYPLVALRLRFPEKYERSKETALFRTDKVYRDNLKRRSTIISVCQSAFASFCIHTDFAVDMNTIADLMGIVSSGIRI